jgi:hypothetical protein
VAKLLHTLALVPIDLVLRLPRDFITALGGDAMRATKEGNNAIFGITACDSLSRMDVTPVLVLDGREPKATHRSGAWFAASFG